MLANEFWMKLRPTWIWWRGMFVWIYLCFYTEFEMSTLEAYTLLSWVVVISFPHAINVIRQPFENESSLELHSVGDATYRIKTPLFWVWNVLLVSLESQPFLNRFAPTSSLFLSYPLLFWVFWAVLELPVYGSYHIFLTLRLNYKFLKAYWSGWVRCR